MIKALLSKFLLPFISLLSCGLHKAETLKVLTVWKFQAMHYAFVVSEIILTWKSWQEHKYFAIVSLTKINKRNKVLSPSPFISPVLNYSPWKHEKTRSFLIFSGDLDEEGQWHEMGKWSHHFNYFTKNKTKENKTFCETKCNFW